MNNLPKKLVCDLYWFPGDMVLEVKMNSLKIINLVCKIPCQKCPIIFLLLKQTKKAKPYQFQRW